MCGLLALGRERHALKSASRSSHCVSGFECFMPCTTRCPTAITDSVCELPVPHERRGPESHLSGEMVGQPPQARLLATEQSRAAQRRGQLDFPGPDSATQRKEEWLCTLSNGRPTRVCNSLIWYLFGQLALPTLLAPAPAELFARSMVGPRHAARGPQVASLQPNGKRYRYAN